MIVYRLENSEGRGPFSCSGWPTAISDASNPLHSQHGCTAFPPRGEGDKYRFGCPSYEALEEYFDANLMNLDKGWTVAVYEVNIAYVRLSDLGIECCFLATKAERIL